MNAKPLTGVSAHASDTARRYEGSEVVQDQNAVILYATAEWLQSKPIVRAQLTPKQARQLAINLLKSADRVEERTT